MKLKNVYARLGSSTKFNMVAAFSVAVSVATVGYILINVNATGSAFFSEPDIASVQGNAALVDDDTASDGKALKFGAEISVPAPSAPTGLRAVTGGNNVALQWKIASGPAEIKHYNVYRDGQKVATVTPDQSNYITQDGTRYYDGDVSRGQTYDYQVSATDTHNAESKKSATINATHPQTTTALPDVTYDFSETTDLKSYVTDYVKPTVDTWYPKVADSLTRSKYTPRSEFQIVFDKEYKGVAQVEGGSLMRVNPQWARDHPEDMGLYIHEMTHVIQSYKSAPTVLTEGIADWTREYILYDREPRAPNANQTFLNGYSPSSYFVNWIQDTQNKPNFIRDANAIAHSEGVRYQVFDQLTGKSVQRLWYEMTGRKLSAPGGVITRGDLCADVLNYDTTNGNTIQVVNCKNNSAQEWVHVYENNVEGKGELRVLGSKCMTAKDSSTANATPVVIWDCNNSPGQQWVTHSDGTLRNPHSGKCLDAQTFDNVTRIGAPLQLYDCNGGAWQKWAVPVYGESSEPAEDNAPATPVDLTATPASDGSNVELSWRSGSSGAPVEEYNVHRDGEKIATISSTNYTDSNVTQDQTYQYQVQAVSGAGKTSALSGSVAATMPKQTADVPAPQELVAYPGGNSIAIVWNPSEKLDVREYTLYRGDSKIATVRPDEGELLSMDKKGAHYIDRDVDSGQTYRYALAVTTAAGDTSPRTQPVTVTQPRSTTPVPDITLDFADAPEFGGYMRDVLKPELEDWYSKTADFLSRPGYEAPTSIKIKADPNYSGYAKAIFDTSLIVLNPEKIGNAKYDGGGTIVHEGTHVAQKYPNTNGTDRAPRWVTEGMARYMETFFYRAYNRLIDLERYPQKSYLTPYYGGAYLHQYVREKYDEDIIRKMNVDAHNNTLNINAFYQHHTGKTVEQLWKETTGRTISNVGIVKSGTGMCADLLNYDTTDGTPIQLLSCTESEAQKWAFYYNEGSSDTGMLQYARSAEKCLDVTSSGTVNNTKVQIWSCNGSAAQQWKIMPNGEWRNPNSGKCLDAETPNGTTQSGARLQIYDCNGQPQQQWGGPHPTGQFIGVAGKCMDSYGFGKEGSNSAVKLFKCDGTNSQQSAFVRTNGNAGIIMTGGKCLEVADFGRSDNTPVQVWDCNGGEQQQWTLRSDGTVRNELADKCLQPRDGSSAEATGIVVYTCDGGSEAQQWDTP